MTDQKSLSETDQIAEIKNLTKQSMLEPNITKRIEIAETLLIKIYENWNILRNEPLLEGVIKNKLIEFSCERSFGRDRAKKHYEKLFNEKLPLKIKIETNCKLHIKEIKQTYMNKIDLAEKGFKTPCNVCGRIFTTNINLYAHFCWIIN